MNDQTILRGMVPGTDSYVLALSTDWAIRDDYQHRALATWPCRAAEVPVGCAASESREGGLAVLWDWQDAYGVAQVDYGQAHGYGIAASPERAAAALERVRELLPSADRVSDLVPVTFWSYGPHGPQSVRRDLDAPAWSEIEDNYSAVARRAVADMVDAKFEPGVGGQLLLWSGEPGTGKTTALRMLAREWREWCDLHYIADPDKFFGAHADYMLNVMLRDDVDRIAPMQDHSRPRENWRVLVLEDSGELLRRDAKKETGQALSRFLNAVDGMIGRGLRVLVLVTTNEDVGELHPAVARPGRCATQIEFPKLSGEESRAWLQNHDAFDEAASALTLADLYARIEGYQGARPRRPVGFAA